MCEHPQCTRSISKKCFNHCQLDLCEEHFIEHENLFLIQYEKSFNNLKKSFQNILQSIEERKKSLESTHEKTLSLLHEQSSSDEFEQKSSLLLSTQNLIKKKLQLLNDVKNDQALLYQYDIEQIKLYRTIIANYDIQTISSSDSSSSSTISSSSSHSNFNPESDNDDEDDEQNYYHKSDPTTRRKESINHHGPCPLTRLGIYGLEQKHHLTLCTSDDARHSRDLMKHFYHDHHIKWLLAYKLTQAIVSESNPLTTRVFPSTGEIIDKRFYVRYCPLKEMNLSNCRKKFFKNSLEEHLDHVHHLPLETRKKIVETIENNQSLSALDFDRNQFQL